MTPRCPWCLQAFASWALAKPHVKKCSQAPQQRKPHAVRTGPKKNRRQGELFK